MKNNYNSFAPIFQSGTLYLSLLNLDSDDLQTAFEFIKDACKKSDNPSKEIESLLAESGWREHLLGVGALLAREDLAASLIDKLWNAFDSGSWVSPQLAVTAWFRDPHFSSNAKARILNLCQQETTKIENMPPLVRHVVTGTGNNQERASKAFSALVYLISSLPSCKIWLKEQLQNQNVKKLLASDADNGREIAQEWLADLKTKSSLLELNLKDCES